MPLLHIQLQFKATGRGEGTIINFAKRMVGVYPILYGFGN